MEILLFFSIFATKQKFAKNMDKHKKNNVLRIDSEVKRLWASSDASPFNVYGKNITYISDFAPLANQLVLHRPILSDTTQLLFVKKGHLDITIGSQDFSLGRRMLLAIPPNYITRVESASDDVVPLVLLIDLPQIMPTSFVRLNIACFQLSEDAVETLKLYGRLFESLQKWGRAHNRSAMENAMASIITFIESVGVTDNTPVRFTRTHGAQAIAKGFMDLLNHFGHERHSVDFYAKELGVSKNYFAIAVKQETGITAGRHCTLRIIDEAKRLLSHTNKSLREIALSLDFKNPAQFGTFFKKHTGQTPAEYRKSVSNGQ